MNDGSQVPSESWFLVDRRFVLESSNIERVGVIRFCDRDNDNDVFGNGTLSVYDDQRDGPVSVVKPFSLTCAKVGVKIGYGGSGEHASDHLEGCRHVATAGAKVENLVGRLKRIRRGFGNIADE